MVELTEEEKEKAKTLAKRWIKNWLESMQKRGVELTAEEVPNCVKVMERIATLHILTEKSKKASWGSVGA